MLSNITTDIDALKLKDINIGIGGAALEQAIGDEVARATAEEYALSQRIALEIATDATTISTDLLQAEINALKNPINNIFSMIKTTQDIPNAGVYSLYTSFDTTIKTSPYITYVAVNINTGGANTGCICQVSGYYKIEYCFTSWNVNYHDRVSWWTRIFINGSHVEQRSFIYTRGSDILYAQYGSSTGSIIKF